MKRMLCVKHGRLYFHSIAYLFMVLSAATILIGFQTGLAQADEVVYQPTDEVLQTMPYAQARKIIESMENRSTPIPGLAGPFIIKNIVISFDKVTWRKECMDLWYVSTLHVKSMKIAVTGRDNGEFPVTLGNVKSQGRGGGLKETPFYGEPFWTYTNKYEAVSLANAFYVLKRYAEGYVPVPESDPAAEAAFANEAKRYREMAVKPALPEAVQKCRILAEDAFKNKELQKALEWYRKGLAIEPLWPQGQFNTAMLEGESQWYSWAVFHMKRYLELVPNAQNATAAREKIYIWEEKAKEEQQKITGERE